MDLRAGRIAKQMTQTELARQSGVNQSKISLAESGQDVLWAEEKDRIQEALGGVVNWAETFDPVQVRKKGKPWTAESRERRRKMLRAARAKKQKVPGTTEGHMVKRRLPKMSEKEIEAVAIYSNDTKRCHKYDLQGTEVAGSLYFSKEGEVPRKVVITLKLKAD